MISLKLFLDALAGKDHPFCQGPDMLHGSALPPEEVHAGVRDPRWWVWEEKMIRFRYMRINKN